MRKIYKIMVSIAILLLISSIGLAINQEQDRAQNGASENLTNPTSDMPVPEIEEAKLPISIDEKARFENRMKYALRALGNLENKSARPKEQSVEQSAIQSVIQSAIPNTIPLDVAYSNPITGTSMFGTFFNTGAIYNSSFLNWKTYSFYLPVASYVYTDISGTIYYVSDTGYSAVYIDGDYLNGGYERGSCNLGYYCIVPIQRSGLTYLAKGWHTLYLDGYAYPFTNDCSYPLECNYYVLYGRISIIAEPEYTAITVTSPNGGESWAKGTTKSITWKKDGQSGANVKIELYKAGVLNSVISSLTPNDGIYSWYIPAFQPIGTDYKIKISSTSEPTKYYDWSNNNFRIY